MIRAVDRMLYLLIKYPDCAKLASEFKSDELPSGFFRKVFEITCENIKSGFDNDLMNYSSSLSSDELGRLSGIIARGKHSDSPKEEFKDCVNVIRNENSKKEKKSAADMTDDEFRKMFNT